jgi:hypothetical protein
MAMARTLLVLLVAAVFSGGAWAQQPPEPPGGQGAKGLAQSSCEQLRAKRGADFDVAGCVAMLEPVAQAAIEECRGSEDRKTCIREKMQPAIKELIGTTADPTAAARTVAQSICANLEKKLGNERFAGRFGDADGCRKEMEPKAKAALTECSKEHKPKTDEHKQCISGKIKSQVAAIGSSKAAEKLAASACKQAVKKNEKKFEKAFGSLENCLAKVVPVAQAAIAKCEQQHERGSEAYKKCVADAMRAQKK